MKTKTNLFKSALLLLAVAGLCSVMSSCSISLEEKYKNINDFVEKSSALSAGEIISEEGNKGGIISSASRTINYKGSEPFDVLSQRITQMEKIKCEPMLVIPETRQLNCLYGHVNIMISNNNSKTALSMADSTNGEEDE